MNAVVAGSPDHATCLDRRSPNLRTTGPMPLLETFGRRCVPVRRPGHNMGWPCDEYALAKCDDGADARPNLDAAELDAYFSDGEKARVFDSMNWRLW